MTHTGKITKILANFYYVKDSSNKLWECFARGRLLKEGKYLYVGDNVKIDLSSQTQGVIVDTLDRANKISKPPIANIDQVIVVFSTTEPDFDHYNLDRYLSFVRYELPSEKILICINKIDLKTLDISETYSKAGFEVVYISALTKEGLAELSEKLKNKTSVLAGPSGTGKSSLIKALVPHIDIKIGDMSSIKQGKHTTRNIELIEVQTNGFLVDTPGFTQFSFAALNQGKILATFEDLNTLSCSFDNCLHNGEEGCTVEEQIKLRNIQESRHTNYLKILAESQEEIIYGTKQESKVKAVGSKQKSKYLPKIDQEKRARSRRKEKQDLSKLQFEEEN